MSWKVLNGRMVKDHKEKLIQGMAKSGVSTADFKPDAGLALVKGEPSHLWFQVAEFIQTIAATKNVGLRGYTLGDQSYIEFNLTVDIMDAAGDRHTAPQRPDGYMATVAFTADNLRQMASEIRKGAMSVRITGVRSERTETAPSGEQFEPIWFLNSWSAGNDAGHMAYMVAHGTRMISSDSDKLADFLEGVADDVANRVPDLA